MMLGSHLVGHWSRTQQVIALSSAEAELNALCKAAQEGLGAKHLSEELCLPLPLSLKTDASAAKGVIQRQGSGKVKHLSVKQLWVQERESQKDLSVEKVPRAVNWSDLLTHHCSEPELVRHLEGLSVERRGA